MNAIAPTNAESILASLCGPIQTGSQLADAAMRSLDCHITQLNTLGLLNRDIILGPIVIRRSYGMDCCSESDELIQAAVATELGTVAVFWDSDDYATYKNDDLLRSEALLRARPLRDCSAAVRSVVWPQVGPLIFRLIAKSDMR